jgi:hypothetical protein
VRLSLVLLATAVALALPAAAQALPGDPPIVPLGPAEGAVVPANAAGIAVSFGCPAYIREIYGETRDQGSYEDYDVRFSNAPALGPDGRLAAQPFGSDAGARLSPADAAACTATLDTYDTASSPEIVGGRVFWQAYRRCAGCPGGYETGPVRSFVIRPDVQGTLKLPAAVYAGYLAVYRFESPARLSGARALLQRRGRTSWLTVLEKPFSQTTEFVAKLPAGRQRLRVRIETPSGAFDLPERTLTVRRGGRRVTSGRDDGSYGARKPPSNSTLRFKVSKDGTTLRDFKASLAAFCVGPTLAQNRLVVAFAALRSARIAPDGSVTGLLETSSGARVLLTGRLRNRSFKGRVVTQFSTCTGSRDLDAVRR